MKWAWRWASLAGIWSGVTLAAVPPGVFFAKAPEEPFRAPEVHEVNLPTTPGTDGIWGALGRDAQGRIVVGVSGHQSGIDPHVLRYDPRTGMVEDLGSPRPALKPGESQNKLHSHFVLGEDGALYFSTMDESGEDQTNSLDPRFGGHLWRLADKNWQLLGSAPKALIAVAGNGHELYAEGYFGGVLYHWRGDVLATMRVGAVGGHISRNLVVDGRGHAYFPRISQTAAGPVAVLVEYGPDLKERGQTPLPGYFGRESPAENHGIIGFTRLADGSAVFTTHHGQLYWIQGQGGAAAQVKALGNFHPNGESYPSGLFSFSGHELIAGIAQRPESTGFDWVVYDLKLGISAAFPLDVGARKNLLLYGSETRDDQGRFYIGGWVARDDAQGQRPILLQLDLD